MRVFWLAVFTMLIGWPVNAATLEQFGGGFAVADNSAAWSAAMASLPAQGGTLTLGCGTYRTAGQLAVS